MSNEKNISYYAVMTAEVRYDKELCPNAKLLYAEITALSNTKGYCWATNRYFAELYKVHKNTISKWVSLLAKKQYIILQTIEIDYKYERRIYLNEKMNLPKPKNVGDVNQKVDPPKPKDVGDINKKVDIPKSKDGHNTKHNTKSNIKKNNKYNTWDCFDLVWKEYPRKLGKEKAFTKFEKQITTKEDYENIKKAVKNYKAYILARNIEDEYISHGKTWFNSDWKDYIEPYKETGGANVHKNNSGQNKGTGEGRIPSRYPVTPLEEL